MEVLKYPDKSQWKELCKRATMDVTTLLRPFAVYWMM